MVALYSLKLVLGLASHSYSVFRDSFSTFGNTVKVLSCYDRLLVLVYSRRTIFFTRFATDLIVYLTVVYKNKF